MIALVEVRGVRRYTPLQVLSLSERAQLKLWQSLLGEELANEAAFVTVGSVFKLQQPQAVVTVLGKRQNGCVATIFMDEIQRLAINLFAAAQAAGLQAMSLVRIPTPYVLLVANANGHLSASLI